MITISDKPEKKSEFFKGSITIVLPHSDETDWNFYLVRHTNGKVEDEVEVDRPQFEDRFCIADYRDDDEGRKKATAEMHMAMSVLEDTVLANVRKNSVAWNPQNK